MEVLSESTNQLPGKKQQCRLSLQSGKEVTQGSKTKIDKIMHSRKSEVELKVHQVSSLELSTHTTSEHTSAATQMLASVVPLCLCQSSCKSPLRALRQEAAVLETV